jgi:two-component system response regulator FixJ
MTLLTVKSDRAEPVLEQATVFVVEHDAEARQAVCELAASVGLNAEPYASAKEFLDNYEPQKPGCLVVEVILPGMTGLELQRRLAAAGVCLPIIFTTAQGEVSTATKAMRAGALDFLVKPFSQQSLLESIQEAIKVDRRRRREQALQREVDTRMAQLTNRQRQVFYLLASGSSTKAIASQLKISPKTVDNHRTCVMEKMGVSNIAQLVLMFAQTDPSVARLAS